MNALHQRKLLGLLAVVWLLKILISKRRYNYLLAESTLSSVL